MNIDHLEKIYRKLHVEVIDLLQKDLPDDLYYHSIEHTENVIRAVVNIAKSENISNENILLLKLAALFHDTGFTVQYDKNEPIGAKIAVDYLNEYSLSQENLDKIQDLILATQMPQKPKNQLEMMICDADLDYLGRGEFFIICHKLKYEWAKKCNRHFNLKEWYELQYNFLSSHSYFTEYSKNNRDPIKVEHTEEIKKLLN